MRSDDIHTRADRKAMDKLAAARSPVGNFNINIKKHFSLPETATIDKMLDALSRCGFRQDIPLKNSKIWSDNFCLHRHQDVVHEQHRNLLWYTTRRGPFRCCNKAEDIVKQLVEPIKDSGRNVTCDNWFVSMPLATDLILVAQ